jgi:long-chain fatty acid transport protein
MLKRSFTLLPSLVLVACLPWQSFAAGFQINETSPKLQGQAMAGSGSDVDDVTAIFNNPALLATVKHQQIYIGNAMIAPHVSMKNASGKNTLSSFPISQSITGAPSQKSVVPTQPLVPDVYYAMHLSPQWSTGFSITAPWGLKTSYDADSLVKTMAQTTSLKAINFAPSIAYQLNSKWNVGLALQAQYVDVDFSQFTPNPNVVGLPPSKPTDLKGDAWGYGYIIGALYTPQQGTELGLSYRSQIDYQLKGHGTQYTIGTFPGGVEPRCDANGLMSGTCDTSVSAEMNTPAVLNLSASQVIDPKWKLHTTLQYTFWQSLKDIDIKMPEAWFKTSDITLNWKNSILLAFGTDYKLNKRWTFRGGMATDQTPTNDIDRDPRIPDSNRFWLTAGTSYHINKNMRIDAAYEHIFMASQSIDKTVVTKVPQSNDTVTTNIQADYAGSADILALGFNWNF